MKKIKQIIFLSIFLLLLGACDKDFVEVNTDPFAINEIDPELLFAGSQRISQGNGWESEDTIVQYFVNPYNLGATLAFNFNEDIDGFQNSSWGQFTGSIKTFVHILYLIENNPEKYGDLVNLKSMVRIMKAWAFMNMVDHYGDVPYFNAGYAALKGEEFFYPEYDDDAAIYEDLYNELKESIAALSASGDYVSADLFYGAHGHNSTGDAATQVAKWKKLGNSLLLRLGLRYTESDANKAKAIATEALNGGVMTSNADNALVTFDGTLYTNGSNGV